MKIFIGGIRDNSESHTLLYSEQEDFDEPTTEGGRKLLRDRLLQMMTCSDVEASVSASLRTTY